MFNHKIAKDGSQCICISVILIHSVYYLQVFLGECKLENSDYSY